MNKMKRIVIISIVLFSCVGCDQATKQMARQSLDGLGTISFLKDTIRLQYAENPGAFLSLGANIPENLRLLAFTVLAGILLLGLLLYLLKTDQANRPTIIALSLVLGGGIGNLIDRVFNEGRVIDFLNLGIGTLRTGVFNVADMAITLGAVWILFLSFSRRHGDRDNPGTE